ncbi:hypothetical protein HMPREF2760_09280 [Corynebacterium sp. HMSC065D07]|nr:hypothetical protein HMPREF2760_09280 [Corynebacterium sp. HMSC065D07]OFP72560.1 hypothetical protein HMPREF2974_08590 [Corynebacterium sp. HMSC078C09]
MRRGQSTNREDGFGFRGKDHVILFTAAGRRVSRRRHNHHPSPFRALQRRVQGGTIDPRGGLRWNARHHGDVDDLSTRADGVFDGGSQAGQRAGPGAVRLTIVRRWGPVVRAGLPDGVDFRIRGHAEVLACDDAGHHRPVQVAVPQRVRLLRGHEVCSWRHP